MKKPRKRLDRPSFWKWAIPLVLGHAVLSIPAVNGAVRSVGGTDRDIFAIVLIAMALVLLVLMVLLAIALAWRFRDIGWPAWIGPTILLVTQFVPPFFLTGYLFATYDSDILEWRPMVSLISDCVSLVLLIVAGSMPGKAARAEKMEVARVFE